MCCDRRKKILKKQDTKKTARSTSTRSTPQTSARPGSVTATTHRVNYSGDAQLARSNRDPILNTEVESISENEGNISEDTTAAAPEVSLVDDLIMEWLERMLDMGVKGLSREFNSLRSKTKPSQKSCSIFTANRNSGRNRYRNVVCLDESRVKLDHHPSGNDYIHANYIGTPFSRKRFICTQAPLDNTIYDFWFMVIQEKVQYVIMLTNFVEKGYMKSSHYFPFIVDLTANYGGIIVKCLECKRRIDFDCEVWQRTLMVTSENKNSIIVKHFHWSDWPDYGVPESYLCPLHLLETVRLSTSPLVIHCSAGIGRSGCLVLIEYVLEKLQYRQSCADMGFILAELRKQRANLVQNDNQYLYIHRTLLEYFITLHRAEKTDEVRQFIEDYERYMCATPNKDRTISQCLSLAS